MDAPYYTGDDDSEFGPAHEVCRECGACVCEDCDGHEVSCSYHPDFYERFEREVQPEEVSRVGD